MNKADSIRMSHCQKQQFSQFNRHANTSLYFQVMDYQKNTRISRLRAQCAAAAERHGRRSGEERGTLGRKRPRSGESDGGHFPTVHVDRKESDHGDGADQSVLNISVECSVEESVLDRTIEGNKFDLYFFHIPSVLITD